MMLVTGAQGQLGTAFRTLRPDATFVDKDQVDFEDVKGIVDALRALRPDAIINCAADMDIDQAEREPTRANAINGLAVGEMAAYAAARDIPFVTYSTSDVFDGRSTRAYVEADCVDPANAYGRSKVLGERLALQMHSKALVIRSSWLLSPSPRNFVSETLQNAALGPVLAASDQRGCPTIAMDLARATLAAIDAGAEGILHLTNAGPTSWYELAREIVRLGGLDEDVVQACRTVELALPAPRPMNAVLGSTQLARFDLAPLPPWKTSLAEMLASVEPGLRVAS